MVFQFNYDGPPQDGAEAFAEFSDTLNRNIQGLAQVQGKARAENAAHDATLRSLEQVKGLEAGGHISPEQYTQVVQEQNNQLQKDGVIRAYENLTLFDELDKSRATLRLKSWEKHITSPENIGAMTQVDSPSSVDDITRQWIEVNKDAIVGQDLAGKDVYAVAQQGEIRVSELLAFGTGLQARKMVLEQEVEGKRNARALEINESLFQQDMNDALEAGVGSDVIQVLATKFMGMGVENINSLMLNTTSSLMDKWSKDTSISIQERLDKIDYLEHSLENDIESRAGAGSFSAKGTTNNIRVATAADQARQNLSQELTRNNARVTAAITTGENTFKNTKWDELQTTIAAKGGVMSGADKAEFKTQLLADLNAVDANGVPVYGAFDKKAIISEFDGLINSLDIVASHPERMVSFADVLNRNSLDEDQLNLVIDLAKEDFLSGDLNYDEYKEISGDAGGKIKAVRTDTSVSLQSTLEKEGSMGWTKLGEVSLTETKDFLKVNNFQYWDVTSGSFKTQGAEDDMYFRAYQRPARIYAEDLMDAGLYGGTVKAPLLLQHTPEQVAYLVSKGVLLADIEYANEVLSTDFVVAEGGPQTVRESRKAMRVAKEKATMMGSRKAWEQLIYFNENPEFKSGVNSSGTGKPTSLPQTNAEKQAAGGVIPN